MQEFSSGQQKKKTSGKRLVISAIIIFAVIPLTIYIGFKAFGNGRYLIVSLLIIAYIMIPFFMSFERRGPKPKEMVILSVMSALTASGTLVFNMISPFQAGTAMAMLTGVCFGPEAGFLSGALARIVCNFFIGQGPWTPWQMFSWAILGFISGVIFNRNETAAVKDRKFSPVMGPLAGIIVCVIIALIAHLIWGEGTFFGWKIYAFGAVGMTAGMLIQRKRLPADRITLSVFAFFATFIIYGGIMNIATMFMGSEVVDTGVTVSLKSLGVLYLSGVPYDAVHALGSAVFMFLISSSIIDKTERVKIKYGIFE